MPKPRLVLALGGNMLQPGTDATAMAQKRMAARVGDLVATLASDYDLIIAHGNGPQVGNLLLHEQRGASRDAPAMPLETAVAMTEGQIGYWLEQSILNAFQHRDQQRKVVSLVTQVVVDRRDPAFRHPTKPIGQFYTRAKARQIAYQTGWEFHEFPRQGWRRVVPSPRPVDIVESQTISDLVAAHTIVIAVGGGGVPVYRTPVRRALKGIDAVVDKDYAAAKLAELTRADIFVSLTAVPCAYINYGHPSQSPLGQLTPAEADTYIREGHFTAGAMLPKVAAAADFASRRGRTSIITDPDHLLAALEGRAGTIIRHV